jgi:hypothetical protein
MATPRNTLVSTPSPKHPNKRVYERKQAGWYGDHIHVFPYMGYQAFSKGEVASSWTSNIIDAPICVPLVDFLVHNGVPPWSQAAYNRTYSRFRGKVVGESAELGAAFAEWRQSLDLITSSATRLYKAYRYARKGKFSKAFNELGVSNKNRRKPFYKRGADAASKWWLEYNFGWAPSIADMYSAMEVLSQPLPYGKQSAASKAHRIWLTGNAYDKFNNKSVIRHKVGADILLVNPNLFLLNQLGILNPAAIAWELTPFSFMVDWVYGVGNYLASFSDWAGLELRNPYHSHFCKYTGTWHIENNPYFSGLSVGYGTALQRFEGIPRPIPTYYVNGDLGTSLNRAANAVSILIQTLLGGSPTPSRG